TTTLYSLLSVLNTETVNIMTLEDPVEYPLGRIRQTSVMEANKLDFSNGIRSIMRQDPDIILVGEIRDEDTANMAFRAAMTGHQVFTTLHTNSALGVFPRLSDIGILPAMMAGNMIGVVAQRLVRVLCPACKQTYIPDAHEHQLLRLQFNQANPSDSARQIFRAQGCVHCENQGYRGRTVIMELLNIDDEIDALISRNAHSDELRNAAYRKGFVALADDALRLVLNGITSLEEVMRVIDLNRHVQQ
ncbi:MAG: ATPase, T2SS/T4P/T4SS family, partial [Methylotenera sp.]